MRNSAEVVHAEISLNGTKSDDEKGGEGEERRGGGGREGREGEGGGERVINKEERKDGKGTSQRQSFISSRRQSVLLQRKSALDMAGYVIIYYAVRHSLFSFLWLIRFQRCSILQFIITLVVYSVSIWWKLYTPS